MAVPLLLAQAFVSGHLRLIMALSAIETLKEARKGFFGCYSVCETMKDTKEGYFIA